VLISIRPADRADIPTILRFIKELAEYEREPDAVIATQALLDRAIFGAPGEPPVCSAIIGEIDGIPEGFALYYTTFSTWLGRAGIYLDDLYVRPSSRSRGLGKALLTHIAKIAHSRGGRMEWAVLNWNEPAIGFYKSLGARPQSEWMVYRLTGEALADVANDR
jgi:GNAT superfamily N-acetyltransferase